MSGGGITCPVCGRTSDQQRSWVHCPAYAALICESHHAECKYLDRRTSLGGCMRRTREERIREAKELAWQNENYAAMQARKEAGLPPQNVQAPPPATPAPPKKTPTDIAKEQAFAEFWGEYPKKNDKKAAATAAKHIPLKMWPVIMMDVRARKKTLNWTEGGGRYVPNAATYLRHERWNDPLGRPAEEEKKKPCKTALKADEQGGDVAGFEQAVAAWRPVYERKEHGHEKNSDPV